MSAGMKFDLTTPCDACPFLKGSNFKLDRLKEFAGDGEFACHKTCDQDEDGNYVARKNGKSQHCAGAVIFALKRQEPGQMLRIKMRLGLVDPRKMDMKAEVGTKPADFRQTSAYPWPRPKVTTKATPKIKVTK